jgi:hypothetical protein
MCQHAVARYLTCRLDTHRLRGEGISLAAATLHGCAGIAVPTMGR